MSDTEQARVRAATEADRADIGDLLAEAFSMRLSEADPTTPLPLEGRWVLGRPGAIAATAVATPGAQLFGGNAVGCALVRAVAVSSPHRGAGIGSELMAGILARARADRLPLSALFPSVPAPYRKLGYEYAGERQVMTAALTPGHPEGTLRAERIPPGRLDEVRLCYDRWASSRPGALVRSDAWWQEKVLDERTYLYAVREGGHMTGYVAYRKQATPGHDLPYYFDVEVRDAAWTTRSAGLSLMSLVTTHAGLGVAVRWPGHAGDLWSRALRAQAPRVASAYPWMLRVVDVHRALSDRGYPPGTNTSVTLSVHDDVLPDNSGPIRLEVAGGKGSVTRVSQARVSLDVGALAPLYSGYLTASELAAEGRLSGAGSSEIAALDAMFAGPRPLIAEMF